MSKWVPSLRDHIYWLFCRISISTFCYNCSLLFLPLFRTLASRTQFPLMLAWAVSIHKVRTYASHTIWSNGNLNISCYFILVYFWRVGYTVVAFLSSYHFPSSPLITFLPLLLSLSFQSSSLLYSAPSTSRHTTPHHITSHHTTTYSVSGYDYPTFGSFFQRNVWVRTRVRSTQQSHRSARTHFAEFRVKKVFQKFNVTQRDSRNQMLKTKFTSTSAINSVFCFVVDSIFYSRISSYQWYLFILCLLLLISN